MPSPIRDLISIVHAQLPAGIRDSLSVDVEADPYFLRVKAIFVDDRKRRWETQLVEMDMQGVQVSAKIPDEFLAQLCAVV